MSEFERAFHSEYRALLPEAKNWGDWVRLGSLPSVTYLEAREEILSEIDEDQYSTTGISYAYRIVDKEGNVVMSGEELAASQITVPRDWEAEGYSEAEILRRWKIVDSMIEDIDEEKADREETLKQMKLEVDAGNFYWIDVLGKLLAEQNDKIFELENYLKIGSEDD